MKKILPFILIAVILVQLFAPFTVGSGIKNDIGITKNKAEAEGCQFVSVQYSPFTKGEDPRPLETTLSVNTSGCVGNFFTGSIRAGGGTSGGEVLNFNAQQIESDNFSFKIKTGETYCIDSHCKTTLKVGLMKIENGETKQSLVYTPGSTETSKDYLDFKCSTEKCDNNLKWSILSSTGIAKQPTSWTMNVSSTSSSITMYGTGPIQMTGTSDLFVAGDKLTIELYKKEDLSLVGDPMVYEIIDLEKKNSQNNITLPYSTTFTGLSPATEYNIKLKTRNVEQDRPGIYTLDSSGQTVVPIPEDPSITAKSQGLQDNDIMPACNPLRFKTWVGCIGGFLYYTVFRPSSALFSISGKLLDISLDYSIKDTSYRSPFVVEGWKIIKDLCNMFFIFILLYVAIGTILNIHSVRTKEMIINVVIIGLLINFSLFATQVIIDTSNILTRVFYNPQTIVTGSETSGKDANGNDIVVSDTGDYGEIKLSEAIVTKIGPQKLILDASKIDQDPGDVDNRSSTGISGKTFLLVVLLASAVNIVGLIVFLTCSLIFISRVIGLWLAMIFAPLAFLSYTVPGLKDMKMVGWKHWWSDTVKMAFLAPIFVFFMYLIIKFLGIMSMGVFDANNKTGMDFIVAIMVPFILVMVLLMKAKSIAKDMSGEIGQSIVKGATAIGGIALGGAALGVASLGRGLGNGVARLSQTKGSEERYKHKVAYNKQLEEWQAKNPATRGAAPTWKQYKEAAKLSGNKVKGAWNPITRIGSGLSMMQRKTNKVDEAREHSDADIEKAGFKGMRWKNMTSEQRNIVHEKVKKENYNKEMDDAEKKYRIDNGLNTVNKGGKLKDLNSIQKEEVRNLAKSMAVTKFEENIKKAAAGVNAFTRVISKTNTGTYDIRNLSNVKADKNASIFSKIPVGLIAAVATGVRGGIMKSTGLSHGSVKIEGKFLDDLKSVFKDSLKDLKIDIPESHGSENSKKVGHGDSGGHH